MKELKHSVKAQSKNKLLPNLFWKSLNILINKPHIINKRLWGCKIWKRLCCNPVNATEISSRWEIPGLLRRLESVISDKNYENHFERILQEACLKTGDDFEKSPIEVIFTELLPKIVNVSQIFQIIIINEEKSSVTFYDVSQNSQTLCPDFTYSIFLKENEIVLQAFCDETNKSYEWLTDTLLPQVLKWAQEPNDNVNNSLCKESLSLVPHEKYYKKYNELKTIYGKEMVKVWPECTDPTKFVYEDVAIATYLLLIWEDYEPKKQSFVDLGCGNGLLVYILTKEGHSGIGYDVRKRNIWDLYENVLLEEKTIVPSDSSLFPKTDWIIGNHSDELTPWIPVIAAKSSYTCNFFLLPCCAYNFDGTKYQRRNSKKSQYNDYLEYISELCLECGFDFGVDRLKIPSTKRICLVSKGRRYSKSSYQEFCDKINEIIDKDTSVNKDNSWVKDFKPRDPVERVRNCTQIDKNLINSIVKRIADYLLSTTDMTSIWNCGKIVEIGELIKIIPSEQLKQLKSECGGLQTLLKNNHNIFKVQNGMVQLRYPKTINEINQGQQNIKIRQKPCWFFNNHPQGCPLSDELCSFLHNK